jgi:hypothetical protein
LTQRITGRYIPEYGNIQLLENIEGITLSLAFGLMAVIGELLHLRM